MHNKAFAILLTFVNTSLKKDLQKNIDDVHLLESKQRTLKDSGNPKDPSEPSIAFLKSSGFNLNKEVKKKFEKNT